MEFSFVAGRKRTAPSSGAPGTSSRSRWNVGCWASAGEAARRAPHAASAANTHGARLADPATTTPLADLREGVPCDSHGLFDSAIRRRSDRGTTRLFVLLRQ